MKALITCVVRFISNTYVDIHGVRMLSEIQLKPISKNELISISEYMRYHLGILNETVHNSVSAIILAKVEPYKIHELHEYLNKLSRRYIIKVKYNIKDSIMKIYIDYR